PRFKKVLSGTATSEWLSLVRPCRLVNRVWRRLLRGWRRRGRTFRRGQGLWFGRELGRLGKCRGLSGLEGDDRPQISDPDVRHALDQEERRPNLALARPGVEAHDARLGLHGLFARREIDRDDIVLAAGDDYLLVDDEGARHRSGR